MSAIDSFAPFEAPAADPAGTSRRGSARSAAKVSAVRVLIRYRFFQISA
jgi:hypothetical protein